VRIEAIDANGRVMVRRVGVPRAKRESVAASLVTIRAAGPGVLAHAAARAGATRAVRGLVERGVHLGVADAERNTLLHAALAAKREAMALALVDAGAVEEARRGTLSPLHLAARDGDGAAVRRLLDARANVKARSARERCTALSLAAEGGHAALVPTLVAAGANANATSGTTPHPTFGYSKYPCVYLAATYGHTSTVAALLDAAADVDGRHSHGWTALFIAACFGDLATIEVLLAHGADVDRGRTRALKSGAPAGHTPLMVAAIFGHAATCTRLVAARANVHARTRFPTRWAAIHFAALQGHGCGAPKSAVPALIAAGADVNARISVLLVIAGLTPLHVAALVNNAAEVEALLACGADPRRRARLLCTRYTALEGARKLGNEAAAAALEASEGGGAAWPDCASDPGEAPHTREALCATRRGLTPLFPTGISRRGEAGAPV
jgi:ankyrin repeat protein